MRCGIAGVECSFASRDGARAVDYNRRFKGVGSFASYDDAIAAPDVDAVLVATPPDSHLALSVAALDAGKHVIIEKPPLMRADDFELVRQAEIAGGARAFVAENYHYKPLAVRVRQLLAENAVGEPLFVLLNALKKQQVDGWRNDPDVGGGALFEGGIHWVNFAASLGPSLRRVYGLQAGERNGPNA